MPIVATFHSKYYDDFLPVVKSKYIAKEIVKWIISFYEKVDEVWTVNEATAKTLREYGYKNDNIYIIPNGVDDDDTADSLDIVDKKFSLNENDLVFLYVGQLIKQKNVYLILKALKYAKERGVDFKMIFAGKGDERKKMERFLKKNGLEKNVFFTGQIFDRKYLYTIYKRANLFIFPSLYDTAGIVVREAAKFSCPSVLIRNSNAASGITENVNGFLVENTVESLGNKLIELSKNRTLLKSVGEKAKNSLVINWKDVVNMALERYKKFLP